MCRRDCVRRVHTLNVWVREWDRDSSYFRNRNLFTGGFVCIIRHLLLWYYSVEVLWQIKNIKFRTARPHERKGRRRGRSLKLGSTSRTDRAAYARPHGGVSSVDKAMENRWFVHNHQSNDCCLSHQLRSSGVKQDWRAKQGGDTQNRPRSLSLTHTHGSCFQMGIWRLEKCRGFHRKFYQTSDLCIISSWNTRHNTRLKPDQTIRLRHKPC